MLTKSCEKLLNKFICDVCDYTTCKKSSFDKHLTTPKHQNNAFVNIVNTNDGLKNKKVAHEFICIMCNKQYKSRVGIWKHKKICCIKNDTEETSESVLKEEALTKLLLNENKGLKDFMMEQTHEFKNLIVEICKNMQPNINTINSHNKTFNLQVFLNETCKDAMNIMDFIDSIKIQLEDLEDVGKLGYVNGISNIIMKNLKELDVTQRPVHCSDSKRETLYVKDQDKWEKEDENNARLRKAIRRIAYKNTKVIRDWRDIHPDHDNSFSKTSDIYQQIVIESMGGKYYETTDTEAKIIKNIAKHVIIDKN